MTTYADFNPEMPLYRAALAGVPDSGHTYDEEFWDNVEDGAVTLEDTDDEQEVAAAQIEGKAVRRVRDARGARRYGQPIGSIIRRDKYEAVEREGAKPDRNSDPEETKVTVRVSKTGVRRYTVTTPTGDIKFVSDSTDYTHIVIQTVDGKWKLVSRHKDRTAAQTAASRASSKGGIPRVLKVEPEESVSAPEPDPKPKAGELPKGWEFGQFPFESSIHKRTIDGVKYTVFESSSSMTGKRWSFAYSGGGKPSDRAPYYATREEALAAADAHIKAHEKSLGKKVAAFKRAPNPGTFWDNWNGIRGYDWSYDEDPEVDFDDHKSRKKMQKLEADELGIIIAGDPNVGDDYVENALAIYRSYEQMFPGITYYNRHLGFMDDRHMATPMGRAAGYNTVMNPYRADVIGFTNSRKGEYWNDEGWDETLMVFNTSFFGDDDATAPNLERRLMGNFGWSSTRGEEVMKAYDLPAWQVYFMNTFHHEVGHTFARVAFGHLRPKTSVAYGNGSINEFEAGGGIQYNQDSGKARREKFFADLKDVFEGFGLRFSGTDSIAVMGANDGDLPRDKTVGMSKAEITSVLSEYGSTNLHEVMAEVWAEYMMDPEPRAFSRAVGDLMWAMMDEYLDNEGAR